MLKYANYFQYNQENRIMVNVILKYSETCIKQPR